MNTLTLKYVAFCMFLTLLSIPLGCKSNKKTRVDSRPSPVVKNSTVQYVKDKKNYPARYHKNWLVKYYQVTANQTGELSLSFLDRKTKLISVKSLVRHGEKVPLFIAIENTEWKKAITTGSRVTLQVKDNTQTRYVKFDNQRIKSFDGLGCVTSLNAFVEFAAGSRLLLYYWVWANDMVGLGVANNKEIKSHHGLYRRRESFTLKQNDKPFQLQKFPGGVWQLLLEFRPVSSPRT